MKTKQIFVMSFLLILALVLSPRLHAADKPLDQLSPQAREAFEKGLAAVEQKEWIVAADSFNKAWKINKQSLSPWKTESEIVFNWGLAESKIPGRELRAIACFNLYLNLGEKDPANAEAVRKEKTALEVRNEARLRQLFSEAKKFAAQMQGSDVLSRNVADMGYDFGKTIAALRRKAYMWVALVQAWAGDFTGAVQTVEAKIPPGFDYRNVCTFNLDPPDWPFILGTFGLGGEDKGLPKLITRIQTEVENNPERDNWTRSRSHRADLLRDTLLSSKFDKASLTDPAGTLQALADKKKQDDLFYGYMRVIEDMVFVLRRADGRFWNISYER